MAYNPLRRIFNGTALLFALLAGLATGLAPVAAGAQPALILALGDSLTAGYGLPPEQSFPAQLQHYLRTHEGIEAVVQNAGVSGDTTAGGLARLDWSLAGNPDFVIIELGANDMLRGLDPAATRANLDAILTKLGERGVGVLLAGMKAPPNLGPDYVASFDSIYPDLAEKHGVHFYPFFLDGVATRQELNLGDGMHPNGDGVRELVRRIAPYVVKLVTGG